MAGDGALQNGDEVYFEALEWGRKLAVVGGRVVSTAAAASTFIIQLMDAAPPPRVGFRGTFGAGLTGVEWFGRGPHESYQDRCASSYLGHFQGEILEQTFPYVRPQENGNKMDTRWMVLKGTGLRGRAKGVLLVSGGNTGLAMQCHRYALEDFDGTARKELQPCRHAGELVPRAETEVCVDAAQMGVGGIDSWGSRPMVQHRLRADQSFSWEFIIRPLSADELPSSSEGHQVAALARATRAAFQAAGGARASESESQARAGGA